MHGAKVIETALLLVGRQIFGEAQKRCARFTEKGIPVKHLLRIQCRVTANVSSKIGAYYETSDVRSNSSRVREKGKSWKIRDALFSGAERALCC
jgi:hypothetical protein